MSSIGFAAEIRTSNTLRRLVIASGWLLLPVGLACVGALPLPLVMKMILGAGWAALVLAEVRGLRFAYMKYRYIRVYHDGSASLSAGTGTAVAARILPGSMLLRSIGWLRLQALDGSKSGELVAGNCRKNKGWRRLHVIWRHL